MKWRTALLIGFVVCLTFVSVPVAKAEAPADAQYAIAACSGVPLDQVIKVERMWDDLQGRVLNLTTDEGWHKDYPERTNRFGNLLGCPNVLDEGESDVGTLTFVGKIYAAIGKAAYAGKFTP